MTIIKNGIKVFEVRIIGLIDPKTMGDGKTDEIDWRLKDGHKTGS